MSEPTPTLPAIIAAATQAALAGARVMLPGAVVSYDASQQRCSVQVQVRDGVVINGERVSESVPIIPNAPVVFFGAGDYADTFPLRRGDTVMVQFSSKSLDRWLSVGGEVDPGDDRTLHLTDAVVVPGLRPFSNPVPATGVHDSARVMSAPMILLGSTAAVDAAIKGTAYRNAEDALFSALGVFATAIGALNPLTAAAAATTLNNAITSFTAASASYLATRVRVQ